eukprot:jgi/Psemu1/291887/fgenesh1_pg.835_\
MPPAIPTKKRTILGGAAALGTIVAINGAVGIGAGAEPVRLLSEFEFESESSSPSLSLSLSQAATATATASEVRDAAQSPREVALPYLDQQIEAAEAALREARSAASASAALLEAQSAELEHEHEHELVFSQTAEEEERSLAHESSVPVAANANTNANANFAEDEATTTATATMTPSSSSPSSTTQPGVTLPYMEDRIRTAEESAYRSSASVVASGEVTAPTKAGTGAVVETAASASTAAAAASASTAASAPPPPSFVRYTKEHVPMWIETGHRVYDAAAPKVVEGSKKAIADIDRAVTPRLIEKEHELLGDQNSAILDRTVSSVARAGKTIAGMMGKAISVGIEGGVRVARATPEVIEAGKQMYDTVDQKIVPEVLETTRKMKTIVDRTVPEVVDTGKHAYDTIVPEIVNAERRVRSGIIETATPAVAEARDKVAPLLDTIERDVLGDEGKRRLEASLAGAAQKGTTALTSAGRAIPGLVGSVGRAADTVADTGRTISRAVPGVVESGKQALESVGGGVAEAVSTAKDIGSDIENMVRATKAIDKAIPAVLETGRKAATTGANIARTVETGGRAVLEDVSGFVDDVTTDRTINAATKRFAASKPTYEYRDLTASVNDPNSMGKL